MNSLTIVVLCAAFAAANAGIFRSGLVGLTPEGAVVQGPSASAAIHGPDGSVIAANQPGGTVIARTGGVLAGIAPAAYAAPLIGHAGPAVVAHHGAVVAGAAPGVIAARAGLLAGPLARGYPLLAPGSGLEGQYVHDYTENLYDNGQYHGELIGF